MKKEIVIAIIFGLLVGLGITFGFYKLNTKNKDDQQNQGISDRIILDPASLNNKQATTAALINITSPENESVYESKDIKIEGETFPNETVVVFINEDDNFLKTDEQGKFTMNAELEAGSNIISAHIINPEDNQTHETQITVIYTTKSLDEKLVSDQEVKDAAQNGTTPDDKDGDKKEEK